MKDAVIEQFLAAIAQYQSEFSLQFSSLQLEKLALYYEAILKWNPLLHLTTLIAPHEFALRNVLESGFALSFLSPSVQKIVDIGSGAGIPGIPLAILRPELTFILVEVNRRKAIFLKEAISVMGLKNIQIANQRFESLPHLSIGDCLVSRAIEQFTEILPALLRFGSNAGQLLFWGNARLSAAVQVASPCSRSTNYLIPTSEERLLISILCFT